MPGSFLFFRPALALAALGSVAACPGISAGSAVPQRQRRRDRRYLSIRAGWEMRESRPRNARGQLQTFSYPGGGLVAKSPLPDNAVLLGVAAVSP
jgi:hypothetical protein